MATTAATLVVSTPAHRPPPPLVGTSCCPGLGQSGMDGLLACCAPQGVRAPLEPACGVLRGV
eukprot:1913237-Pleurochrysis_carterae.AAC.7